MIGVTFDQAGLFVAARIFSTSGPVTGWIGMTNFDGNSYNLAQTLFTAGAYSIKKVVFTDGTFTVRNTNYSEADDAIQIASAGGGGGGATVLGTTLEGEVVPPDMLVIG